MRSLNFFFSLVFMWMTVAVLAQPMELRIVPENPTIALYDTVQFTYEMPIDMVADSFLFTADQGQAIMMQMDRDHFFAKRIGRSGITCKVYMGNQVYVQTTVANVVEKVEPTEPKLAFAQRSIRLAVNSTQRIVFTNPDIQNVKIETSDPGIANVDADMRVVKGIQPGSAKLVAYWENQEAVCEVQVFASDTVVDPEQMLEVIPDPIDLQVGEQIQVEVVSHAFIKAAILIDVADKSIADFDEAGLLAGKTPGVTCLQVIQGPYQKRTRITVHGTDTVPQRSIRIEPNPIKLAVGTRTQIFLHTKHSTPFTFKIADPEIARISPEGVVYGTKAGETYLVASQGRHSDTALIVVVNDDTEPVFPVVKAEMKVGQSAALKRLFPRINADMQMDINARGVIRLDASLKVYAVSAGRAIIDFYTTENEMLFRGVIAVVNNTKPNEERIDTVWLEDSDLLKIRFLQPLDSFPDERLKELVKVEVLLPDEAYEKSGDWVDILDAYLSDRQTLLVVRLSREIQPHETVVVTVQENLLNGDQNEEGTREFIVPAKATAVSDVQQNEVRVFPNPVSETLQIRSLQPMAEIQVYDVGGRLWKTVAPANTQQTSIDVRPLPEGVYILKITNGSKEVVKTSFSKK